jgi:hypothetical protein
VKSRACCEVDKSSNVVARNADVFDHVGIDSELGPIFHGVIFCALLSLQVKLKPKGIPEEYYFLLGTGTLEKIELMFIKANVRTRK